MLTILHIPHYVFLSVWLLELYRYWLLGSNDTVLKLCLNCLTTSTLSAWLLATYWYLMLGTNDTMLTPLIFKYFPIENMFIWLCLVDGKVNDQEALELFLHQKAIIEKELGTSQTLFIDKLTRAIKGEDLFQDTEVDH